MKLNESSTETAAWADDVWSFMQCGIILLLGYLVTRAWLWYRSSLVIKAKLQNARFEGDGCSTHPKEEVEEITGSASTSPGKISRQSNAQARKRMRKGRGSESSNNALSFALEMPGESLESKRSSENVEEVHFELPEAAKKSMADNMEVEHVDRPKTKASKANKMLTSLDSSSPPQSSAATIPELPTTNPAPPETGVPTAITSEVRPDNSSLQPAHLEAPVEHVKCEQLSQDIPSDAGTTYECTMRKTDNVGDGLDLQNNIAFRSTQKEEMAEHCISEQVAPYTEEMAEHCNSEQLAQDVTPCQELLPPVVEAGTACGIPCNIDWDLIESDSDDDLDVGAQTGSSQRRESAPILWCSSPHTLADRIERPGFFSCIDNWVPVAIPSECAPPGTLDGRWMNSDGEKILIERLDIMFESGVVWAMTMLSPTQISVDVDGNEFEAELDQEGDRLIWNDGDVWTFHGRVEVEEQPKNMEEGFPLQYPSEVFYESTPQTEILYQDGWNFQALAEQFPPADPWQDMNCVTWEGSPFVLEEVPSFVADETLFAQPPIPPVNQMVPPEAKDWEICWDWKKKGCCPRGLACDWYHPSPSGDSSCQPCEGTYF